VHRHQRHHDRRKGFLAPGEAPGGGRIRAEDVRRPVPARSSGRGKPGAPDLRRRRRRWPKAEGGRGLPVARRSGSLPAPPPGLMGGGQLRPRGGGRRAVQAPPPAQPGGGRFEALGPYGAGRGGLQGGLEPGFLEGSVPSERGG